MKNEVKTETVAEFLARGGQIQRIPATKAPKNGAQTVKVKGGGINKNAEIYVVRPTKKNEVKDIAINYDLIPSDLLETIINK